MEIIKGFPDKELQNLLKESLIKKPYLLSHTRGRVRDRKFVKDLQNNGFKWIKSGISRDVFIKGKYVLKVTKINTGALTNKHEIEIYQKYKRTGDFTKIFSYDKRYRWIITEKVEYPDNELRVKYAKKLREKYKNNKDILFDLHAGNIGDKDGRPVILDYGGYYKNAK